jgi:hypothetical protein
MTALGRHRTYEAPLTASDRARLENYHREQLARFTGTHDAAPRRSPTHIHVHLPAAWATQDTARRRPRDEAQDPEPLRRNGGSSGGLPLATRTQNVEPESAGFEDEDDPVGARLMPGDTFNREPSLDWWTARFAELQAEPE